MISFDTIQDLVFLLLAATVFCVCPLTMPKRIEVSLKHASKRKRVSICGEQALNRVERLVVKIDSMLKKLHKKRSYFYTIALICMGLGIICGAVIFRDVMLSCITGIAFAPLAYLCLMFQTMSARRMETNELENTMQMITNAYLSNDDIIGAFQVYLEEKNRGVDERLREVTPFDEFLADVTLINPNLNRALLSLDSKIDNHYFHDWIDKLMLCEKNREMKGNLQLTLQQMNDEKHLQAKNDTAMIAAWRTYLTTAGIMFSIIPILKNVNEDWFYTLTRTTVGKGLILLMIAATLIGGAYIMKINKPVEYM